MGYPSFERKGEGGRRRVGIFKGMESEKRRRGSREGADGKEVAKKSGQGYHKRETKEGNITRKGG